MSAAYTPSVLVVVGNLEVVALLRELLLDRHNQLDEVERVGVEVVHERGVHGHLVLFDPELLDDQGAHSLKGGCHWFGSSHPAEVGGPASPGSDDS